MALLNLGDDPWLLEYESCEKLQRDIMEQLSLRQSLSKSSEKYASISASVRIRLKQFQTEVKELRRKLDEVGLQSITFAEKERRNRQIELLMSKYIQMQKMFDDDNRSYSKDRMNLMGTSAWGNQDDDLLESGPSNSESIGNLREQRQQLLEDQDRGLENLSNIIARQKNIAHTISTEVDLHNDIIDDLGEHIDRTDIRIATETRNVSAVDRKDKTCIYWVIIILLFLSIITVVAI